MKVFSFTCLLIFTGIPYAQAGGLPNPADVVIYDGQIIDGNGTARFRADVVIQNKRIIAIGSYPDIKAKHRIEASGLIVAPGFIDAHNHSAIRMINRKNRLNESSLTQGVSTIVFGADGEYSPTQITKMLNQFKQQGIGTNVAFYVGHNGIRSEVMLSKQQRKPTDYELEKMRQLVREGMAMGAVGFSTGLMYEPGRNSEIEEIIELTKVIAEYGGIYDSHVRSPARDLISSDQEVIDVGLRAKVAAKIAHVKAVCLNNSGKTDSIIQMVQSARDNGQHLVTDQYPYDGAKTLYLRDILIIPDNVAKPDTKKALANLHLREAIRVASENGINGGFSWLKVTGYNCIRITYSEDYPLMVGKYLSQLAQQYNLSGFDLVSKLLLSSDKEIHITLGGVDEKEVQQLMIQPWNMIASDGKYINSQGSSRNHPRSTGSFARVLGKYVREMKLFTLEEAITKMTSLPADFLGLSDRGRIEVGKIADIVIFNEGEIIDRSSWAKPLLYSAGINQLLVNGKPVFINNKISSMAQGEVLSRTHKTSPYLKQAGAD